MSSSSGSALDASAVLAYLKREPGYQRVQVALVTGASISVVNLAEVYSKVVSEGLALDPVADHLLALGLLPEPFTEADARICAGLYLATKPLGLSLGDRACLALGLRMKVPVMTADRAWTRLQIGVQIEAIR